jgi:hypothetical protein
MRSANLALLLCLFLAQTAGLAAPLTYCLAEGTLCCSGWAAEDCCETDAAPGVQSCGECSDLIPSSEGALFAGLPFAPTDPGDLPHSGSPVNPLGLTPATRGAGADARGSSPPPLHLSTVVLLL